MGTNKTPDTEKSKTPIREVPPHSRTLTAEGWRRKREKLAEEEKGSKSKKKSPEDS